MINVIDNTQALIEFCNLLNQQKFITVDLEFLREKSYYAQLCLIQVGFEGQAAIIDPLAPELDLSSFFVVMQNPAVTKVFHSGRQDIEIIYNLSGFIPTPLFDTQVAAQVCGFGESVSYETLVNKIIGISLDKTCRLTNWSKRPLDLAQLEYAISDVTHLVNIYLHLQNMLIEKKRTLWIEDEMEILKNPTTYYVNPQEAWLKIKHRSHNPHFLTILRELAAWRENRAQTKNTPRQSIIKDDCLLNIAAECPTCQEELENIRNIRKDVVSGKLSTEILEVITQAKQISPSHYIIPMKEKSLSNSALALFELLKLLLRIRSQEEGVVNKIIGSEDDLKMLSMHINDRQNRLLKGWRLEIFGQYALALRDGKLQISYNPKTKSIDLSSVD